MKFIYLLIIFTLSVFAIPLNKQIIMNMSMAYGYYLGQSYTLDKIKEKYSQLSNDVLIAKTKFDLSFGKSIKNIDTIMGKSPEWKNIKEKIKEKIHSKLDVSYLTYNESIDFINTVKKRAKGKIASPVLETLLMLNPKYEENPQEEFYDGFKKKYISDDLVKSKGLTFSIEVPMSWASRKANRPNIVRKFISQNGYGSEMAMILIYNLPEGKHVTENEIKNSINREYIKTTTPTNAILKGHGFIRIENLPGYWQKFIITRQRLRKSIKMETLIYRLFYKDKLIQLSFMVGSLNSKSNLELEKRFKKFKTLFDLMANSFVLRNLYQ
jgi:hypothetical protein